MRINERDLYESARMSRDYLRADLTKTERDSGAYHDILWRIQYLTAVIEHIEQAEGK